jgi:hypothetical protein
VAHVILSATHTDTLADAVVRGDVLYGNATPNWARLPKGTDGYVLAAGATDVAWATPKVAVANEIADATCYVGFFTDASGNLTAKTNAGFTFNAATGVVTAAGFTSPGVFTSTNTATYGFIHDVTVDQEAYESVYGAQTASTLQSGAAYTGTDVTMATKYIATSFVASGAHHVRSIGVRIKVSAALSNGTAYLTGALYSDVAGVPGALIDAGTTIYYNQLTTSYQILQIGSISQTLVPGTTYWIVLYYMAAPTGGNLLLDGANVAGAGATSPDGTVWTGTANALYHLIYGRTFRGVYGGSTNNIGILGASTNSYGVHGSSTNSVGVSGVSTNSVGVSGVSTNYIGVSGISTNYIGVYGSSTNSVGVRGLSTNSAGISGISTNYIGVSGISTNSYAGYFSRNTATPTGVVPVVYAYQDHASDPNTCLRVRQDGAGYIQDWYAGAVDVAHLATTGVLTIAGAVIGASGIVMADGATIGQAAGPLIAFDDTNNYLEITGANVALGYTAAVARLHVYPPILPAAHSARNVILCTDLYNAGVNGQDIALTGMSAAGVPVGWNWSSDWSMRLSFGVWAGGYDTAPNEYLVILPSGGVGIGTTTVPHGGIGYAKFAIDGTDSSTAGPHVQFTTAADDYPLFHHINYAHDAMAMVFDAYWDGADYRSSDAGSNYQILKQSDLFSIRYDSGIAQGAAITWNDGIVLNTSGNVGIGGAPTYRLDVFGGDINIAEGQYYRYGAGVLAYAQTALHNYYFGSAGNLTTTGTYNTAAGDNAAINLAALAHGNTMLGASAGYNSSTGTYNVFVGMEAGYGSGGVYTDTHYNVAMGYRAAYSINGASGSCSYNVMLGANAGVTYGGDYLTAVGASAAQLTTGASNTAIGYMAGYACSTGACNVFLGREAGRGLGGAYTVASSNVVIGYRAEYDCASDLTSNTVVGYEAGYYNRNGSYNAFFGHSAGKGAAAYTGALHNVAIGYEAGLSLTTDSVQNVMVGSVAGRSYAGSCMTAIGYRTLYSTTGTGNTAVGYLAGQRCSTGICNTFVGHEAGYGSVNPYAGSNYNTAVGYQAGYDLGAAALNNTFVGAYAGQNVTTGDYNVLVGSHSGDAILTGTNNVLIGTNAGYTYAGSSMVAVGGDCLVSTTGTGNVGMGYDAGYYNRTGTYNVFVGLEAGFGSGGVAYDGSSYNTMVGYRTGYDLEGGANFNVLFGALAGTNITTGDNNVCLGYYAGKALTTQSEITAVGGTSLLYATGVANVALGFRSGYWSQTGTYNTFLGYEAGYGSGAAVYDGSNYNTCVGYHAGYDFQGAAVGNTLIGALAGENITTGDGNVCLGYLAGAALTTEDNYLYIANSNAGLGATTLTGNFATGSIGIGMAPGSITARLHLPAGDTGAGTAPLKFIDGNTLATIEQGAVEMYKSTLWFQPCATLIKQSLDGTIFSQTTAVTVANTNVATTLVGAGRGDGASPINLPANFFCLAGKTLRVTARGYYGGAGGGGPYTITVSVILSDGGGDTVLLQTAALAVTGRSNLGWEIQGDITCYATGAAGTFWGQGFARFASTTTAADVVQMVNTAIDTNMDTTAAMTLDVRATWNTADAANSITCTNLIVESVD